MKELLEYGKEMTQEDAEKRIKELCQYPIPDGFLEPEKRNGYLVSALMKRVWAVQMDMMQKLLDVCKKHGLRVWADSGTLLGAVRHHGYIPWDDDLDFVMPREDYDRLVKIAPEEFTRPYFFQCMATEKRFPVNFAQIRMDGTAGILPVVYGWDFTHTHQGIFVDVFPLDEVPDVELTMKDWIQELRAKQDNLRSCMHLDILRPFQSLNRMWNFDKNAREYENCLKRYDDGNHNRVSKNTFRWVMEKKWYDHTLFLSFEYLSIPVPACYHEILSAFFGDYRIPLKSSSLHGNFWQLDPDTDFHHYLQEQKRMFRQIRRKELARRIKKVVKQTVSRQNTKCL